MEIKDWLGVGVFIVAVAMTGVLMRVRIVRKNPAIAMAFFINPGLVGVLAALAFWLRDTPYSFYCWLAAMLLMVPTVLLVGLAIPRVVYRDLIEQGNKPMQEPDSESDSTIEQD